MVPSEKKNQVLISQIYVKIPRTIYSSSEDTFFLGCLQLNPVFCSSFFSSGYVTKIIQ